jgi:hypothetical protein
VLGYGRQDMDRETVRLGEIHGYELNPCLHERGYEGYVSSKAIELRNDQRRLVQTAGCESSGKLRAIRALTGLDFREFLEESP